jgi:ComEC/Rec2-related protein
LIEAGTSKIHRVRALMDDAGCSRGVIGKMAWNTTALNPGGLYWIKGRIRLIADPIHLYSFDYKRWMGYKQVHYEWVEVEEIRKVGENVIVSGTERGRKWVMGRFSKIFDGAQDLALVGALVLGIRSGMPEEMKRDYADAGAIHVMAVSGLHVGIVYMILNYLLGFINSRRRGMFIMPFIWGFGYITGSAAAVKRAAAMFTWHHLGESSVFNILFGTAFFLLVWDPYLLWDVGFQLSFSAVVGILVIHPVLNRFIQFRNKGISYLWDLTTVGIGAQLATLPFVFYYFGRFPVYFWLSGWLVVPAAGAILCLGMGALILPPWLIAIPFKGLVWLTNYVVAFIARLPGAVIEGLYIDVVVAWILGLLMAGLFFFRWKWMWLLFMLVIYSGYDVYRVWFRSRQMEVMIYAELVEVRVGQIAYQFMGNNQQAFEKFRFLRGIRSVVIVEENTKWTVEGRMCIEKKKDELYVEMWGDSPAAFYIADVNYFLKLPLPEGSYKLFGRVDEKMRQQVYDRCACFEMDCQILSKYR